MSTGSGLLWRSSTCSKGVAAPPGLCCTTSLHISLMECSDVLCCVDASSRRRTLSCSGGILWSLMSSCGTRTDTVGWQRLRAKCYTRAKGTTVKAVLPSPPIQPTHSPDDTVRPPLSCRGSHRVWVVSGVARCTDTCTQNTCVAWPCVARCLADYFTLRRFLRARAYDIGKVCRARRGAGCGGHIRSQQATARTVGGMSGGRRAKAVPCCAVQGREFSPCFQLQTPSVST